METRKAAIDMLTTGISQRKVAMSMKCTHGAIQKLWKKYTSSNSLDNAPKFGRPAKTTARERRSLTTLCRKHPFKSARELKCEWFSAKQVSVSTIKRILRKYNLFGRRAARKPFLSKVHRKNRLLWCRNYRHWTSENWKQAIFTDECQILLYPAKKVFVRRPINARYKHKYVTNTYAHGLQSIMIWGGIKGDGSRFIQKCPSKVDAAAYGEILKGSLFPFYEKDDILIQDNAPIHRAKTSINLLEDNHICYVSDWPSQSPDINIIENMWAVLKRNLWKCCPKNTDELWAACQAEWRSIPNSYVTTLFSSIPRRFSDVIKNKGYHCKY